MPNYRRVWRPGDTYFFTVNLLRRHKNDLPIRHIDALRQAVVSVRKRHPFEIHCWVVLPEHLHCILELPVNDTDYSLRWRLIKMGFSKAISKVERCSSVRQRRGERGIWQRRFWEHLIRNEEDYAAHMDYIHLNSVKHGYVSRVKDWPHSTFHRLVEQRVYPVGWAGGGEGELEYED